MATAGLALLLWRGDCKFCFAIARVVRAAVAARLRDFPRETTTEHRRAASLNEIAAPGDRELEPEKEKD